jgi:hypothetical protein
MFLSPAQVLIYGLDLIEARYARWSEKTRVLDFHRHFGSSPLDITDIWYDLVNDDKYLPKELRLISKEKNEKGFKRYMMVHFWLWTYPRNSSLLASRFKTCERLCRGEDIWKWIKRIAAMKAKKISMDHVDSEEHVEFLSLTTDGVDFAVREEKHPTLPMDTKACSHKMNQAAAKYGIALALRRAKCVHICGPYKGGVHDLVMFREGGLKDELLRMNQTIRGVRQVKLCVADRGYHSDPKRFPGDNELFSLPNGYDSKELNNYKSRGRLRHETFNARLKCFGALSQNFCHGFKNKYLKPSSSSSSIKWTLAARSLLFDTTIVNAIAYIVN